MKNKSIKVVKILLAFLFLISSFSFVFKVEAGDSAEWLFYLSDSSVAQGTGSLTMSGQFFGGDWRPVCTDTYQKVSNGVYPRTPSNVTYAIYDSNDQKITSDYPLNYQFSSSGITVSCGSTGPDNPSASGNNYTIISPGASVPTSNLAPGTYRVVIHGYGVVDTIDCSASNPTLILDGCGDSSIEYTEAASGSGETFTVTPVGSCSINSFTADNQAPASGTGTTLRFSLGGGSYPWNISLLSGSVSPSPNSGTGSSGTASTGNLTQSQTYRLTCGSEISDLTVNVSPPGTPPPPPPPPSTCTDTTATNYGGVLPCTYAGCTDGATMNFIAAPTNLTPGQTGVFTVRVTNTGNSRWYHGNAYRLVQQSALNITPTYGHLPYQVTQGDYVDWTFNLTAPSTPSNYVLSLRMMHYSGIWDYKDPAGNTCAPPPASDTPFGQTGSASFTVANPTVTTVATISSSSVITNNTTQYNVVVTGTDTTGGANLEKLDFIINYQGSNGDGTEAKARGAAKWRADNVYASAPYTSAPYKDSRVCTGGGSAVIWSGTAPWWWGAANIHLDACSVTTSGNTRSVTYTLRFAPVFTAPTTNNDISSFAQDTSTGVNTGWVNSDLNFSLSSPAAVNDSQFISQTINNIVNPSSITLSAGQTYPVSITMKNIGSTIWRAGNPNYYGLGSMNPVGTAIWQTGLNGNRSHLTSDVPVSANDVRNFNIIAPSTPGTYNFQWRMVQDGNNNFYTPPVPAGYFGATTTNVSVTVTAAMSGTLTPASSSCIIPLGQSNCNINFSWNTVNPVATSSVTKTPNITVSSGNTANNIPFTVKYNSETFYLYNNAVLLDQETVSSACAAGSVWNGSSCVAVPSPTGWIRCNGLDTVCAIAYNASATISWSSSSTSSCQITSPTSSGVIWTGTQNTTGNLTGSLTSTKIYDLSCVALDGSVFRDSVTVGINTTPGGACTDSCAVNAPLCTINSSGTCCNGAINPPTCNIFKKQPIYEEE